MKYWIYGILGAIVMFLLVVRLIYTSATKQEEEKKWYIKQLDYDFSARVDSILYKGVAVIQITGGKFNPRKEKQLRRQLKEHERMFIVASGDGHQKMRVPFAALKGDSVYVNSSDDVLSLYRGDSLLISRPLNVSLRFSDF